MKNNTYSRVSTSDYSMSILPKSLFLVISILGALIIWFLKYNGFDAFVTIALPVALLFIYCGLAWKTTTFQMKEEQIGDNAYYLGFLFTLSSLAYALWKFQAEQGGDPADIIGSFGVALWSTIFGVALRVFFSQMQTDPNDIEREARNKISQAANRLSQDMNQANLTFNKYTRRLQQSVEESFTGAQTITKSIMDSLSLLNQKINSTETPNQVLNQKIEELFDNLKFSTQELEDIALNQKQSIAMVMENSNILAEKLQMINKETHGLAGLSSGINESNTSIASFVGNLNTLAGACSNLSKTMQQLENRQDLAVKKIEQHADALQEQLERSREYTLDTLRALSSMTKTLKEEL